MIQSQHERENQLLRLCLRPQPGAGHLSLTRQLFHHDLDWEYIYNFSVRHSLLPFLYHQLKQVGRELVPGEYLKRFKTAYHANVARTAIFTDELLSITRELQLSGIESLPFKGPVLGAIAYGNPALRSFIDLDLIVRRGDVLAAKEILLARGYRTSRRIDDRQQQLLLDSQHNIQFERTDGCLIVELHWRVSADWYAAAWGPEQLWKRLGTVTLNDVPLNSLSIEDLLLALCIHGSRHFWEKLCWICDVAALISGDREIDWDGLLTFARRSDTEGIVLLGLCLAGAIAPEALPAAIKQLIAEDERLNRLAGRLTKRLFSGTEHVPLTRRETFKYSMLMRKSWPARVRYCLFALSPADLDLETLALPRYLNFVYYGVRPLRLVRSSYHRLRTSRTELGNSGRGT